MLCPLEIVFSDWPFDVHHSPESLLPALATSMPSTVGGLARPRQQKVCSSQGETGTCMTSQFLLQTLTEDRTGRQSPEAGFEQSRQHTQVGASINPRTSASWEDPVGSPHPSIVPLFPQALGW